MLRARLITTYLQRIQKHITPITLKHFGVVLRNNLIYLSKETPYSFRHTGAIEIFKRTGSITKLQKAMGHASINVPLTYLRGLEVAELEEGDMPMI